MKKLVILLMIAACTSPNRSNETAQNENSESAPFSIEGVYANNEFAGARMNNFEKTGDDTFTATISPENTPINSSAYYAFQIWSDQNQTISLSLKYTHHKHRYIPKLSIDGENYKALDRSVSLNSDSTVATFEVGLSSTPLWIAAQEVTSSASTYKWVDELVEAKEFLSKERVGRTEKETPIYIVKSEKPDIKPSAAIIARQHPPEIPGGSIAFKAFFETLVADTELANNFRENFNLYVFPLLNPDGADLGNWRHNAFGADLNRDWKSFIEHETVTVRSYLTGKAEEGKRIRYGIDFHTSYNGPYLLIFEDHSQEKLPTQITPNWISAVSSSELDMNDYRKRSQDLPYCYNWFYWTFDAEAVTYEEGDEIDRSVIRARAQLYAEKWMESMLGSL